MDHLALDYVSPLPPVRSGIADYSADLLPHIEPLCDLRVVRLPGQAVSEAVVERWRPVDSGVLGEAGRTALYHMGNNQYHEAVYRLAMRHPGVLTLHDVVLHHFLLGATLGRGKFGAYRRRLGLEHGWQGEAVAGAVFWGAFGDSLQFGFPANRRLVRRQRGILVHSEWARQVLLEEEPDLAVRTIPMGIPLPARIDPELGRQFRRRRGIPLEAPLLGSFGFQTPMKRPRVAVRAMTDPALADAHLVIAGELAPTLDLAGEIAEAGLGDRIHVTGFLDYDEFEAAIAACDLALNLRYPSAGETSAALLRVLALGRPTVVSEYAQFAELPDEAAVKIPVGEGEREALVREASTLLADADRLRSMGEAARDHVRHQHDPRSAAAAMVEACVELSSASPPPAVGRSAPSPTTLTCSRLTGEIEVAGLDGPWLEGERRRLDLRLTNRGGAIWQSGTRAGSVVFSVAFLDEQGRVVGRPTRCRLPRNLPAGDSEEIGLELRRPLGRARLHIESRLLGEDDGGRSGGLEWAREI